MLDKIRNSNERLKDKLRKSPQSTIAILGDKR